MLIPRKLVMVCIPNRGNIRAELVNVIVYWLKNIDDSKYKLVFYTPQLFPTDSSRNHCVKEFLKQATSDEDVLWFIDDDIVPPINSFEHLVNLDKDVVTPVCLVMKPDDNNFLVPIPMILDLGFKLRYGTSLEEIGYTGTGCLLIKKRVLKEMKNPFYFTYKNGELDISEDFNFCNEVRKHGFSVWCDYRIVCDHFDVSNVKCINDLLVRVKNG